MDQIQCINIDYFYYSDMFCPFCGCRVVQIIDEGYGLDATPCPHTLFIGDHDYFNYRSKRFDEAMGYLGLEDDDIRNTAERGFDELTDNCNIPNSIKIAAYDFAPSFQNLLVGFAAPE